MANDGQVPVTPSTATNLLNIDNSMIGPTTDLFRQRVVLGDDSSSGRLGQIGSTAPAGMEYALYTRQVGSVAISSGTAQIGVLGPSSSNVIGSVAPSSAWSVVTASATSGVVSLTTTANYVTLSSGALTIGAISSGTQVIGTVVASSGLGASTAIIGSLSSGTAQIGILGPSSANVIGSVAPSSNWALSSGTAQIGILGPSSANVIGSVAQSSNWNISTGAVVGLTTTATVGLTTTSLVGLTTALNNYVTLAPSSANVVGTVAQSSNWNISTGAVVGLTTTSVVSLTTTSVVGLSSALSNYITNSTTVPVYLGASTSNIVGIVGLSSAVTLSSGSLTIGALTTGTVVGLTTTSVVGISTAQVVFLSTSLQYVDSPSTQNTIVQASTAGVEIIGGIAASTAATPIAYTSGGATPFMTDIRGRVITNTEPRQNIKSASVVTANTCGAALVTSPGAGLVADIFNIVAYTTTALAGTFYLQSSSGQAAPGAWSFIISAGPTAVAQQATFPIGLIQPTANNGWFAVSTSSGVNVTVQVTYAIRTT